ncbi:MAG: nucleoside triphosphate pyrophosphohydrolase [Flavobacteriales bacterium]|nr:nucleoside triphosphate pyrophosphohydrolase [Flavobacteriales bacterium]
MTEKQKAVESFARLYDIVEELRQKCPWDRKQTFSSLRTNTIEEAFELSDAIFDANMDEIRKECGDVMLHIIFYAIMGHEAGAFTMNDILEGECEKLIRRHPHVYGNVSVENSTEVKQNWEKIKLQEGNRSVLSGVPRSLPAMIKAQRIKEKVSGVGFDWEKTEDVWAKVEEEIGELKVELERGDKEKATMEMGDVFFSLINYASHIGINAEDALEMTNKKFIARFTALENKARISGKILSEMSIDEMEKLWQEAKKQE